MRYVSQFDSFGSPISIRGYKGQTSQKSVIGGLTTIIVYSLSFCYFIYIMVLWQLGDIGPSVARYNDVLNYTIYESGDQSLFDFTFFNLDIDPFSDENLVLIPLLVYEIEGVQTQPVNMLKHITISKFGSIQVQTNNLTLILNNQPIGFNQQNALIYIADCDQKYLEQNQTCASKDVIDKFKKQSNYIFFFNTIQTYNTRLNQIQSVQKKQYLALDYESSYNLYISLNSANLNVEDGLLFQNLNFYKYIEDISLISQVQTQEVNNKSAGFNYYFCFALRLSPLVIQVDVRYKNLGEIFAMVGSIASVLMSIGILIKYLNGYYQDNILIYKILQQYFPNKILVNHIGQITDIKGLQDYQEIKKLQELAQSKLNILNIIYQISRIELFLIYKFGRNQLLQANDFIIETTEESQEMTALDTKRLYIEDIDVFKNQSNY